MRIPILTFSIIFYAFTATSQNIEDINRHVLKTNNYLRDKGISAIKYNISAPEKPNSEAPEGLSFSENMNVWKDSQQLYLVVYEFLSTYNKTLDSIWYKNDQPVFLISTFSDLQTDTKIISRIWLYNKKLLLYEEHNSDLDDAGLFTKVEEGTGKKLENLALINQKILATIASYK